MLSTSPDVARLQPTNTSLNVILKNTSFRDDILNDEKKVKLRFDYSAKLPVLIFGFQEPFYDFLQILTPQLLCGSQGWLDKETVEIKLLMADNVITDQLSTLVFHLTEEESRELKERINMLNAMNVTDITDLERYILSNTGKFLNC